MKSFRDATRCGLILAALSASLVSAVTWAQSPEAPAWLDVRIIQVKGGATLDFEDRVKELQAARKSAGLPAIQVFSIASGHPNEYHMVTLVNSFGENDNPRPPMGPGAMAAWISRITSTVDSVRFFYAISYPQHAIQGQQGGTPPQLLLLRTTRVISGKESEYEDWIANQFMPAFRQTNPTGHTMSRGVFGDSSRHFYHAVPIANWAVLDQPDPMLESLGERRLNQMVDALDGVVEDSTVVIARIRRDLM